MIGRSDFLFNRPQQRPQPRNGQIRLNCDRRSAGNDKIPCQVTVVTRFLAHSDTEVCNGKEPQTAFQKPDNVDRLMKNDCSNDIASYEKGLLRCYPQNVGNLFENKESGSHFYRPIKLKLAKEYSLDYALQ
ncbi:hypothetical protein ACOME3_010015 [Neoechinorhynchus agilis]